MAETSKAKPRLIANGFYDKHIVGKKVIDVGVVIGLPLTSPRFANAKLLTTKVK